MVRWHTVVFLLCPLCAQIYKTFVRKKFHLNEFSQIFVADRLCLHCYSHFIVPLLTVLGRNVRVLLCVMWHV